MTRTLTALTALLALSAGCEIQELEDADTGYSDECLELDKVTFYADGDGDGYGTDVNTKEACEAPAGYVAEGGDCDDQDAEIAPDAAEVCDGVDNNCDDEIDNDATDAVTFYADIDGDGYGDESDTALRCEAGDGYVEVTGDCDIDDPDAWLSDEPISDPRSDFDTICAGYCERTVLGSLSMSSSATTGDDDLSCIVSIEDYLNVSDNSDLTTLSLPNLTSAGVINISGNPSLTDVDLGAVTIAEAIHFDGNDALESVTMGSLQTVDNYFEFYQNSRLESVSFPALTSVGLTREDTSRGGYFNFWENDALASLDFPALEEVGSQILIIDNPALCADDVDALVGAVTSESSITYSNDGPCQ